MSELLAILEDLYDAERLLAAAEWLDDPSAAAEAHDLIQGAILGLETATESDIQDMLQTSIEEVEGLSTQSDTHKSMGQ